MSVKKAVPPSLEGRPSLFTFPGLPHALAACPVLPLFRPARPCLPCVVLQRLKLDVACMPCQGTRREDK